MRINNEIESKIIAAAEELYLELGSFPSIDRVRRRARAGMWDTARVVGEWRLAKSGKERAKEAHNIPAPILTVVGQTIQAMREQVRAEVQEELDMLREELDLARADIEMMVLPWPEGLDENVTLEQLYQELMAEADQGGQDRAGDTAAVTLPA